MKEREKIIEECKAAITAAFMEHKGFGGLKARMFTEAISDVTFESTDAMEHPQLMEVLDHLKTHPLRTTP